MERIHQNFNQKGQNEKAWFAVVVAVAATAVTAVAAAGVVAVVVVIVVVEKGW